MAAIDTTISPVDVKARAQLKVRAGDTVRVTQKVIERTTIEGKWKTEKKERARLQVFEGLVLSVKHGSEPGAMFTVRKVVDGVGVERIFPLYAPMIEKIEIVRRARMRRAKLYHVREKAAKEIRRQMKRQMRVERVTTERPQEPVQETASASQGESADKPAVVEPAS